MSTEDDAVRSAHVRRVLSNNAVLAAGVEGLEVVALGRGLGFGLRPGDPLDPTRVEQVFIASEEAASYRLTKFLADVPLVCVRAAVAAADVAHERLGLTVTQALILPLADHLSFAWQRQQQGLVVEVPLRFEVRHLYPAESAAGEAALARATTIMGVDLDPDEAVSLALHFVNAQFASAQGLGTAVRMTERITQITDSIERTLGVELDPDSMSTARFVTHLRYLFSRLASGKQIAEPHPTFIEAIANAHPEAMTAARRVGVLIEMGHDATLTPDETAYLAMHIARLAMEVRTEPGVVTDASG